METLKKKFISKNSEQGSVQPFLLLFLSLMVMTSVLILGFLHSWRNQAAIQLGLDECVEKAAHLLEHRLNQLEISNIRMAQLRVLILAQGGITPETAPLRAALQSEYLIQEGYFTSWNAFRLKWLIPGSCFDLKDRPVPLPEIPISRPPPDPIGPNPFLWNEVQKFKISIFHSPRRSNAEISKTGTEKIALSNWKAIWTDFY